MIFLLEYLSKIQKNFNKILVGSWKPKWSQMMGEKNGFYDKSKNENKIFFCVYLVYERILECEIDDGE